MEHILNYDRNNFLTLLDLPVKARPLHTGTWHRHVHRMLFSVTWHWNVQSLLQSDTRSWDVVLGLHLVLVSLRLRKRSNWLEFRSRHTRNILGYFTSAYCSPSYPLVLCCLKLLFIDPDWKEFKWELAYLDLDTRMTVIISKPTIRINTSNNQPTNFILNRTIPRHLSIYSGRYPDSSSPFIVLLVFSRAASSCGSSALASSMVDVWMCFLSLYILTTHSQYSPLALYHLFYLKSWAYTFIDRTRAFVFQIVT